MHKLLDYVCDELDELERKVEKGGKLSTQEVQYMDTLAHTKKNLLKSEEMSDGYSGRSYMRNPVYSMDDGMSYARGRRRDSMGRYSARDDYSRNGYAMDGDSMIEELKELMRQAPEHKRQKFQRFISEMEQM